MSIEQPNIDKSPEQEGLDKEKMSRRDFLKTSALLGVAGMSNLFSPAMSKAMNKLSQEQSEEKVMEYVDKEFGKIKDGIERSISSLQEEQKIIKGAYPFEDEKKMNDYIKASEELIDFLKESAEIIEEKRKDLISDNYKKVQEDLLESLTQRIDKREELVRKKEELLEEVIEVDKNSDENQSGSNGDAWESPLAMWGEKVKSTKKGIPLELIHYEAYLNKKDSIKTEKFFKTGHGREIIKDKLQNYFNELNNET